MNFNLKKIVGIGLLSVGVLYIVNKIIKAIHEEENNVLDELAIDDINEINQCIQEHEHVPKQQEKKIKKTKKSAKREMETVKQKKKGKTTKISKKKIIIGIIIVGVLFAGGIIAIRIITAEKEPISIVAFIEVMHENGYGLLNVTEEAVGTSFEGYVHTVLVAANADHQFELFEFINTRNAQLFFQDLVTTWEANGGLSPLLNSLNGMNFSIFQLTTNDNYYQILRVENILILAQGNQSCQSDIRKIFRLIENAN